MAKNFDTSKDAAVITGGTSGIGLEYLHLLAAEKCRCVVISNERLKFADVERLIRERHDVTVDFIDCDLSNYDEVIALEEPLGKLSIKVLINNAGFGLKGNFVDLQKDEYRRIVGVNALAPTLISHMVLPAMQRMNCGLYISVASINVAAPMAKNAVYTATKHYIWSCALAVAKENRDFDIRFQIMLPGTTDTPFHIKQGVTPAAMTMQADVVAKRSLDNLHKLIFIPNLSDRIIYPLGSRLPLGMRMSIASYLMKKRLGI
ncbi:MAG: SDR family NAD(P)-dependent oxidoreductase [Panacagrimonas sp.]